MGTKERIIAIRLMEQQKRNPQYFDELGVSVRMVKAEEGKQEIKTGRKRGSRNEKNNIREEDTKKVRNI